MAAGTRVLVVDDGRLLLELSGEGDGYLGIISSDVDSA
jgi:hypothetical protein